MEDEDFITQSLGSSHPTAGQVSLFDSSIDASESDLDFSDMLKHREIFQISPPPPPPLYWNWIQMPCRVVLVMSLVLPVINMQTCPRMILIRKFYTSSVALGNRLTKIEKHDSSIGEKNKDRSKVKSRKKSSVIDNSTARRPTVRSDNGVVPPSCQSSIGTSGAKFPPSNVLRQEQKIWEEIQFRLKELADLNLREVVPWMYMLGIGSNDLKSMSSPVSVKRGLGTISSLPFSGWLGFTRS